MKAKKALIVTACALALALVQAAAETPEKPAWLSVGPRIGATGVVTTWSRFNAEMQDMRSADRDYFPLYSQIGFNIDQRIRLDGGVALIFRETLLLGGLDQNIPLPSATLLAGVGLPFGLELLIGPEINPDASDGDADPTPSLALAAGWVFSAWGRPLPVSVVVVPLSVDWEPRVTALVGIDFPIRFRFEKKKPPFNY